MAALARIEPGAHEAQPVDSHRETTLSNHDVCHVELRTLSCCGLLDRWPSRTTCPVLTFTLSEEGVAAFRDALVCLNKFSDDVSLEARKESVRAWLTLHLRS